MSQTYTLIALIGFSLAAVLVVVAIVMFFSFNIKQVRNDLTGKTAARSIAEIRSRAKTRKRSTTDVAKRLGWEQDISSGQLADFSAQEGIQASASPIKNTDESAEEGLTTQLDGEEALTTCLSNEEELGDEQGTTILGSDKDKDTVTKDAFLTYGDEQEEGATTMLASSEQPSPGAKKDFSPIEAGEKTKGQVSSLGGKAGRTLLIIVMVGLLALPTGVMQVAQALSKAGGTEEDILKQAESILKGGSLENNSPPFLKTLFEEEAPSGTEEAIKGKEGVLSEGEEGVGEEEASEGEENGEEILATEPPQTKVKVEVYFPTETFYVPYGAVDIEELINQQASFFNCTEKSLDELRDLFIDRKIVRLTDPLTYPKEKDLFGFEWGAIKNFGTVELRGEPSTLKVEVASIRDWLLEGITLSNLPATDNYRITGKDNEAVPTRLWVDRTGGILNEDIFASDFDFFENPDGVTEAPDPFLFPSAASFQLPSDASDYPVQLYARAKQDRVFNEGMSDEIRIKAQEIVKLPLICLDADAPGLATPYVSITDALIFQKEFYADKVTFTAKIADPVEGTTADEQANRTSGLARIVLRSEDGSLEGKELTFDPNERVCENILEFSIEAKGRYQPSLFHIDIYDVAGQSTSITLSELSDASGNKIEPNLDYLVINPDHPKVELSYVNPVPVNSGYYAQRKLVVTLEDDCFPQYLAWYEALSPEDKAQENPVFTLVNTDLENDNEKKYLPITMEDFKESGSSQQCIYDLGQRGALDGHYKIIGAADAPTYQSLVRTVTSAWADDADRSSFVYDTHNPEVGTMTFAPAATQQWNWLFAADEAQVAWGVTDGLSGVDADSIALSTENDRALLTYAPSGENALGGTITWTLPARDQSVSLEGATLNFADKAGNTEGITNIAQYDQANAHVEGIFVDAAAPVISVAYDNNEVRNGKYYNAARTATLTLEEASFSFVLENDPYRVVAKQYRNGSERSFFAKDFSNPSGNGSTWITTAACDSDGIYRFEADFTDPSGKSAQPYRGEEFVIDTVAPLIMLTFDNNDAESGSYFKAPRTAEAVIHETNFSADLAEVAVSARDAAGSAVGAPGISGWQEASAGEWSTSIGCNQELHYQMELGCTDLAGNVATVVTEPEFVIDMTPPVLTIERVADATAYKDEIAPQVSFSDTNFEPYLAEVTITGSSRGDKVYFSSEETLTDTSRVIDFKDFSYDLEVDDVYTLAAKVKDRAGNETDKSLMFSVNRFGSNYELSEVSQSLLGSYVKRGEDIVITETNVSGLTSSSARLAHNDKVEQLKSNEDYTITKQDDRASWSRYTYTFPAKNFEQDGYYRLMLSSVDAAGGLSENLMEGKNNDRKGALAIAFAIDGTSPVASVGNVEGGASYYAPNQRIDMYADDNMEAERATLTVDGTKVEEWDAAALKADSSHSYDLPASEGTHRVSFEVVDKAGNTTVLKSENILVTNDLVRYVLHTPAILYPLIVGVIAVVGIAVIGGMRVISKRRPLEVEE